MRILVLLISLCLAPGLGLAQTAAPTSAVDAPPLAPLPAGRVPPQPPKTDTIAASPTTNTVAVTNAPMPAPTDPTPNNITRMVAGLLGNLNFIHHPFDQEIANKFMDRYLDALDGLHVYFLQSDLDEFAAYRTNLARMTVSGGDTSPGQKIFARFLERARQRVDFATNYLVTHELAGITNAGTRASADLDFTGHDHYTPDRRKLPNPKSVEEAKSLWQEEARYEFLQEKLGAPNIKFAGPVSIDQDGKALIQFTSTKDKPLHFVDLPSRLFTQDKRDAGHATVDANQTNAYFEVSKLAGMSMTNLELKVFSDAGAEVGRMLIHLRTNETDTTQNDGVGTLQTNQVVLLRMNWTNDNGTTFTTITTNQIGATTSQPIPPPVGAPPGWKVNVNVAPLPSALDSGLTGVIELNRKNLAEIARTLTNRYAHMEENYTNLTQDDIFELYLTSLAHAYDPHSDYMGRDQAENFGITMRLSLVGIGALLQTEDGYCKIRELYPGPAMRSKKIKVGDRIVAVAQGDDEPVDIVGMPVRKAVNLIRGEKGTEVRLTIIPVDAADSAARKVVPLVRDEIKLEDQEAKGRIFEEPTPNGPPIRLGLIDLPSFYADMDESHGPDRKSMTKDVAKLLKRFNKEGVKGVIIDLRRNGGGFLEEAVSLTGLFIKTGPVVQTMTPDGQIVTDADTDPSITYDGPLVLLTSRFSASASEIVAGALQDYNRALIVGDKTTFGKGTVQSLLDLSRYLQQNHLKFNYDPGQLKLTVKAFYRAGGATTQSNGVAADIVLPSLNNYAEVGESVLENALALSPVTSADPENLNRVAPYLADLKRQSEERRARDKDFSYLQDDINEFIKSQTDKSVSLNEAERLADQQKHEAALKLRQAERRTRPKPAEKTFDLTLQDADQPALKPAKERAAGVVSIDDSSDDPEPALDAAEAAVQSADSLEETKRILLDYIQLVEKAKAMPGAVGKADDARKPVN